MSLSKNNLLKTILVAAFLIIAGFRPLAGSVVPVNLQCEYHANPPGIDEAQPRLSWQVQSNERNQGQTAYQILVAGSKELLQNNHGDLWESGRISSDETPTLLMRENHWRQVADVSGRSGFGIKMAGHRHGACPPCGTRDCSNRRTGKANGLDWIKAGPQIHSTARNGFGFPRGIRRSARR
jgi:hypothetical protein